VITTLEVVALTKDNLVEGRRIPTCQGIEKRKEMRWKKQTKAKAKAM